VSKSRPRYQNTRPSDEEEDYFLQRSETGDSRLQQKDLLRYVRPKIEPRDSFCLPCKRIEFRVYVQHWSSCLHYLYPQENAFLS